MALSVRRTIVEHWSELDRGWRATIVGLTIVGIHALTALL